MKKLTALLAALLIVGCCTTKPLPPVPPVVVKTEIQRVTIPQDLLDVSPMPDNIDLSKATQKDIAAWITNTEQRLKELEQKMIQIKALNK